MLCSRGSIRNDGAVGLGGRSCFIFVGLFAEIVIVDCHVAVGEGSGDVL